VTRISLPDVFHVWRLPGCSFRERIPRGEQAAAADSAVIDTWDGKNAQDKRSRQLRRGSGANASFEFRRVFSICEILFTGHGRALIKIMKINCNALSRESPSVCVSVVTVPLTAIAPYKSLAPPCFAKQSPTHTSGMYPGCVALLATFPLHRFPEAVSLQTSAFSARRGKRKTR